MDTKLREILEKVERGELTPTEAAALLAQNSEPIQPQPGAIQEQPLPKPAADQEVPPTPPSSEPEVVEDFEGFTARWKNWWVVPLWIGAGVFVLGAIWIAWGNYSQHFFWFYCGIFPLLLGLGVMGVSFWSRQARWLHVRIKSDRHGRRERIAISMPLPITLVGWFLKTFGARIPGLREQHDVIDTLPEMLAALDKNGDPLIVEVNDKGGEEVRVYII